MTTTKTTTTAPILAEELKATTRALYKNEIAIEELRLRNARVWAEATDLGIENDVHAILSAGWSL